MVFGSLAGDISRAETGLVGDLNDGTAMPTSLKRNVHVVVNCLKSNYCCKLFKEQYF